MAERYGTKIRDPISINWYCFKSCKAFYAQKIRNIRRFEK